MGLITKTYTFTDGTVATASEVNTDLDTIYNEFNGNIDENNIKDSSTIPKTDKAKTITAEWTFTTKPDLSGAKLKAADLDTSEVATLAMANTFTAKQTFNGGIDANGGIENAFMEQVASLPTASASLKGRIVYNTTDNKFYGCDGTNWLELSYIGGYTGGAVKTYTNDLVIDDNTSKKVLFKTDSGSTSVKVFLQGDIFPKAFYTELGEHNHGVSGITATTGITDSGHTHDIVLGSHTHSGSFATSTHTHSITGDSNYTDLGSHNHGVGTLAVGSHTHTYYHNTTATVSDDTGSTAPSISGNVADTNLSTHRHWIDLTSGSPSAYASVASTDLGTKTSASAITGITASTTLSGNTDNKGVNGGTLSTAIKTYLDSVQIYLNGSDITNTFLSATGWSKIGDGTATHAFITSGTGEVDIFSSCTTGMNTLEIIEPTSGKGGRCLAHIEIS